MSPQRDPRMAGAGRWGGQDGKLLVGSWAGKTGLVPVLEGPVCSLNRTLHFPVSLPSLCTLVCEAILAPLSGSPALWELGPVFSQLWVSNIPTQLSAKNAHKLHIFIFSSLYLHIINIYIICIYLHSSLEQIKKSCLAQPKILGLNSRKPDFWFCLYHSLAF